MIVRIIIIILLLTQTKLGLAREIVIPDSFDHEIILNFKQESNNKKKKVKKKYFTGGLGEFITSNWVWVAAGTVATAGIAAAVSGGGGGSSEPQPEPVQPTPEPEPVQWMNPQTQEIDAYKTIEYKNSYFLESINAANAYATLAKNNLNIAGDGVKIIISDSRVANHSEFSGKLTQTFSSSNRSHGTHVAGISAAKKDNKGMHGVAFNAEIVSTPLGNIVAADNYDLSDQTKIINTSWGYRYHNSYTPSSTREKWLQHSYVNQDFEQLKKLFNSDSLLIASAGNSGRMEGVINPQPISMFSSMDEMKGQMISNVAVDSTGKKTDFSNPCGITASRCLASVGNNVISAAVFSHKKSYIRTPYKITEANQYTKNYKYSFDDSESGWVRNASEHIITENISGQDYYIYFYSSSNLFYIMYDNNGKTSPARYNDNWSDEDKAKYHALWDASPIDMYDDKNQYISKNGTSMSAPVVTGAAAVIEGAWNYLDAKQIADIILVTAKPTYADSNGGVTYDVSQAASSDINTSCGGGSHVIANTNRTLSCTYGQGTLDLGAAVSSHGSKQISVASQAENIAALSRYTLDNTHISNNLLTVNASDFKDAVFFDYFGRHYKANLGDNMVAKQSNNDNYLFDKLTTKENYKPLEFTGDNSNLKLSFRHKESKHAKNSDPLFKFAYNNKNLKGIFNFGMAINDLKEIVNDQAATKYLKSSFLLDEISDGYFYQFNNLNYQKSDRIQNTSFRFGVGFNDYVTTNIAMVKFYNPKFHETSANKTTAKRLELIMHDKKQKSGLAIELTDLAEKDGNFLGVQSSGAFNIGHENNTQYSKISLFSALNDDFTFLFTYTNGESDLGGNKYGLFQKFNKIKMQGYSVGLVNNKFFDGKLGLIYAEPLTVKSGKAYVNYATGRDKDTVFRTSKEIDLTPNYQKRNFEVFWHKELKKNNAQIGLNYLYKKHDIEKNQNSKIISLTLKTSF